MKGRIVKGIAGFYYVYAEKHGLYECKAKGIFRNKKIKPLVGDFVEIQVIDEKEKTGNIVEILPRENELIRPAVANVDQALIVFSVRQPNPNLNLLDKFLVMMEYQNIETIICFNKTDLGEDSFIEELKRIYNQAGYPVFFTSTTEQTGVEQIKEAVKGKCTVLAGPSGVGKSSMLNALTENYTMETGSVSNKIGRGRHTTRHSEIFHLGENTYVFDTPGFSSLYVPGMTKEALEDCFPEFFQYAGQCRFSGCAHIDEPDCQIKKALQNGKIDQSRYQNYKMMYGELKEKENRYD